MVRVRLEGGQAGVDEAPEQLGLAVKGSGRNGGSELVAARSALTRGAGQRVEVCGELLVFQIGSSG